MPRNKTKRLLQAGSRRGLYHTYLFRDKDPAIDILRTLIVGSARIENISLGRILGAVSRETNVSYNCLHGWFFGRTQRPQHATLEAVARHFGKSFNTLTDLPGTSHALSVEHGRRGGKARAAALTPNARTEIARKAAQTRWSSPNSAKRGAIASNPHGATKRGATTAKIRLIKG